ncbi:GT2D2 protein, partial [Polyodon spathula]|nr:GT2D2 protein [Polyodon spathula]
MLLKPCFKSLKTICKLFFSLLVDESTDVCNTAQICIFLWAVFEDCSVKEDILAVVPLTGKTCSEDIYLAFKHSLQEIDAPLQKLVSIATHGALAMLRMKIGFIAMCKNDPDFPDFFNYHHIIHLISLDG